MSKKLKPIPKFDYATDEHRYYGSAFYDSAEPFYIHNGTS